MQLLFFLLFPLAVMAAEPNLTVETSTGAFHGEIFHGARLFPYIAYSEAPIGAYRWRKVPLAAKARQAPKPVQCPQTGNDQFEGGAFPMQEDCLYMNVWAPQDGAKHKVILWIHGGGLISGNGVQRFYDGSIFTDKGIVFVAFNYRLTELGYGPNLEKEQASLGHLDMLNAVEWVTRNIEKFGGDPNQIYLMGHSKGAEAIGAIMESGAARENIKGGIAMSGGRHFEPRNNVSFDQIQLKWLPGERDMPWEKVVKLKPQIGVYVPVLPHFRGNGEESHRFKLILTSLYDERFWGGYSELYCRTGISCLSFNDYVDSYFLALHPGVYDHGQDVYGLFSRSKFGVAFRDYIAEFVNQGELPSFAIGGTPEPFIKNLQMIHLFPWFSLPGTYRNVRNPKNLMECIPPWGILDSQGTYFWAIFERTLNLFGYGRADRDWTVFKNRPLRYDPDVPAQGDPLLLPALKAPKAPPKR